MLMTLARIGVSACANLRFARIAESMVFASFAVKQRTMKNACSTLSLESELMESQEVVSSLLEKGP